MNHSIGNWLCNKEEQMTLFEEDGDVTLTNQTNVLLLGAELTSTRTDGVALQYWARLGTANLAHFQRALAQNRNTGALWLTQRLKGELMRRMCSTVWSPCSISAIHGEPSSHVLGAPP
jgi:hypothetical protein